MYKRSNEFMNHQLSSPVNRNSEVCTSDYVEVEEILSLSFSTHFKPNPQTQLRVINGSFIPE